MGERLRPINVDGQKFRWRFDDYLVVIPANQSGPQLVVDWGWRDWLEPEGVGNEPVIVTPKFVAAAIRFAIDNGWKYQTNGSPLRLRFEPGVFHITKNPKPT